MVEYERGERVTVENPLHPSERGYTGTVVRKLGDLDMYEVCLENGPYQGIEGVYYLGSSLSRRYGGN